MTANRENLKFKSGYDHLNRESVKVLFSIDDMARAVVMENYGVVRLLAAIVRARAVSDLAEGREGRQDKLSEGIKDLIARGLH